MAEEFLRISDGRIGPAGAAYRALYMYLMLDL